MIRNKVIHPLQPIFNQESKVLILGSFPSIISRQQSFYYANPTNRFWKVLENVYNEEIIDRESFCLKHHIALWDVIHSCTIHGSLDSTIQDVQCNPIEELLENTKIKVIFTTGTKASSLYKKYIHLKVKQIALPSTSSANAKMHVSDLVKYYSIIREYTDEKD